MPVRNGSPGPSTLSALALGIPCSETTNSAQFWVLPYISFHLDCRRVEKRGRICGGTFVPHLEQKPPHPFPLKNKNLPVETRAASPQPFMFQYLCRSPMIRLHFMDYISTSCCYMYSSVGRRVNAKRLPPLSGKTGRRSPEEKSRAHSISSTGDRSGT